MSSEAVAAAEADSGEAQGDSAAAEFARFRSTVDDLDRALAEERAMAITLIDTIKRLDAEGEELRSQAKA
ncbi:hypothetical protein [Stakelama saccharophila]|uniref:Nucleotide exchange factor GrpE n=1 Tax=Stakelama saccharophila TaxID=3075605 RepID=A0ABZ0BCR1_9SPHN|nr:hypothetical protein [Stakelama sp. W311]WNO54638.1 hypothetical protein RPR59_05135 [Stakelama sp. W311]